MMPPDTKLIFNHREVESVYAEVWWDESRNSYLIYTSEDYNDKALMELEPYIVNTLLGVLGWLADHNYETEPANWEG